MGAQQIQITDSLKRSTRQKPVYAQVVAQIQYLIENGELNPGDQLLPERELAAKLGVSRPSVRQALAVLDGQGVIEVTPRDGAYVRRPSLEGSVTSVIRQVLFQERQKVVDQFEVRRIFETQAVRLAALRHDAADLQRLRELNQQFETQLRVGDIGFQANTDFHLAICKATKNLILTEIMTTVLKATMEVYASARQQSLSHVADWLQFVREHEEIIEAIAQQDPDQAAEVMARHIDSAQKRVEMVQD
jgi:GntR family transcriptional repressor for pyruvate dehydrogenase complex